MMDVMWSTLIEANGISVVPVDEAHVMLQRGRRSVTYAIVSSSQRVHPSRVGAPPEQNAVLVTPALSAQAALVARARGWSAVPDQGPAWLLFDGEVVDLKRDEAADSPPLRRRGRPGWGVFSVVRALLAAEGDIQQAAIAAQAGVTQARVSQALGELASLNLVTRLATGWTIRDRAAIVAWWRSRYPGPGGISSHWFGPDSVVEQAYRVHRLLADTGARPAISGDVAADLVAPWRTPQHALLYAERGADLTSTGLTPADPGDATLTLILPADRTVWSISENPTVVTLTGYGAVVRAGALQVLYDLDHADGPDHSDASQAWLDWMLVLAGPIR
jgi:hypothetical protein